MKRSFKILSSLSVGFFSFLMCFSTAQAQTIVSIADGGQVNDVSCSSSVVITDSNANGGNYGPNESFTITICIEDASTNFAEIIISPALYGDIWDVDANSSLFIYDGIGTGGPLLGVFNSVSDPAGITVSGNNACMTMQFISGSNSSGAGFTSTFSCIQPLQPFLFDVVGTPELAFYGQVNDDAIQICFGDTVTLDLVTNYPLSDAGGNGYAQADATSFFRYVMGDGTIYQGTGLNSIEHVYLEPFGYQVTVTIRDINGRVESDQFFILIAPRPDFSNLPVNDTLCIGEQTIISGGVQNNGFIGVDATSSAILGGGILGEQLYLPDGNDENYQTSIIIDEFPDGQTIQNASDIINFCVNMEHSFLGDLEMMLSCPDGTSINVFNSFTGDGLFPGGFGGGGTFLGDANDFGINGVPGIGFDYCFSMNAAFGTLGQEFQAGNTILVNTFQVGNAMSPGTYLPEEGFVNFIGCPLNGNWTLTIRDNLGIDDGFIFNWSIYFDPNINPNTVFYSPEIVEVMWADNPDIVEDNGNSILVEPSQPGDNAFTFIAIDEFGCIHDTTVFVYIRPLTTAQNAIACDLTHTLVPANAPGGGTWEIITAPTATATAIFDFPNPFVADVTATEYGIYDFLFTDANCSYTAASEVDFRPDPQIAPFPADTTLCLGASIVINAGPQQANSDNFFINWSLNGSTINTTDYAITADQTGTYTLTLSGVCGTETQSTDVISIAIAFMGDTICGRQAFGQVTVEPEGNGLWSADVEGISFSNVNLTSTSISAQNYGNVAITYTDSRCVNDGLTRNFRFVEQPVALITPPNPEFCVELDILTLTVQTTGSDRGNYIWAVNGTTETTNNDTIQFAPLTFEPLENYAITVLVQDEFLVCPLSTGQTLFEGLWCTYNIPNVITPNGDGANDRFHVEFLEFFPGSSLRLYDRWGKMVFEDANYDQYQVSAANGGPVQGGWDGGDVESGTYFYELLIPHLRKIESGYLQILDSRNSQ